MDASTRSLAQRLRGSVGEGAGIRMATLAFADFSVKAEDKNQGRGQSRPISFDVKFA
jgi:hypothetical protein